MVVPQCLGIDPKLRTYQASMEQLQKKPLQGEPYVAQNNIISHWKQTSETRLQPWMTYTSSSESQTRS